MSKPVHASPIIDYHRVVESTPPARWVGPDQAIIALIVLFALFLFGLAGVMVSEQPEAVWYSGAPAVVLASGGFCLLIATLFLLGLRQRRLRHERLTQRGVRYGVERVRSVPVRWKIKKSGGAQIRWAVAAIWRDSGGQEHEAIAGPFDYDPNPLLRAGGLTVLADLTDPTLSRILPEGLPAARHACVAGEQRALAKPVITRAMVTAVVALILILFLLGAAWLAYPLLLGHSAGPTSAPQSDAGAAGNQKHPIALGLHSLAGRAQW